MTRELPLSRSFSFDLYVSLMVMQRRCISIRPVRLTLRNLDAPCISIRGCVRRYVIALPPWPKIEVCKKNDMEQDRIPVTRCVRRVEGRSMKGRHLRTNGRTYGRRDEPFYRNAMSHLKI